MLVLKCEHTCLVWLDDIIVSECVLLLYSTCKQAVSRFYLLLSWLRSLIRCRSNRNGWIGPYSIIFYYLHGIVACKHNIVGKCFFIDWVTLVHKDSELTSATWVPSSGRWGKIKKRARRGIPFPKVVQLRGAKYVDKRNLCDFAKPVSNSE